jgi:peptidoglycan hydrolase-like protein with peptidoglycan-binding domain
MRNKIITKLAVVALLLSVALPFTASASALTTDQMQSILNLLISFGADQATIASVSSALIGNGGAVPGAPAERQNCGTLTHNLYLGSLDSQTGGDVSKLQKILGITPTGRFGTQTQTLVKQWQAANGIPTTSTSAGNVGPTTRAAMQCK